MDSVVITGGDYNGQRGTFIGTHGKDRSTIVLSDGKKVTIYNKFFVRKEEAKQENPDEIKSEKEVNHGTAADPPLTKKKSQTNLPQYIYVFSVKGRNEVKIGISNDTKRRYKECLTMNPHALLAATLLIPETRDERVETKIHEKLKQYRMNDGETAGKEWFKINVATAVETIMFFLYYD